jgi:GntR family transcriptional regulator
MPVKSTTFLKLVKMGGQMGLPSWEPVIVVPKNFEPHYRRIIADLRRRIAAGEFPPGAKLPSTRALADQYGVAPGSVRQAITLLTEVGELRGHQGLGVFVPDAPQGS